MVTLARTQDFTILQSKQQTWRTYGAGDCRVFDDILVFGVDGVGVGVHFFDLTKLAYILCWAEGKS